MKKALKSIKVKICILTVMLTIFGTSVVAYAMDKRVTASHSEVVYDSANNRSKATGYITAKSKHYCSVKLFRFGSELKYSGRKYGKGKVSNSTGYAECGWGGAAADGSAVYYGFD